MSLPYRSLRSKPYQDGLEIGFEDDRTDMSDSDFERKLLELRSGETPAFLVSSGGVWQFWIHQPSLRSGPYLERLANGTVYRWNNRVVGDVSFGIF